MTTMSLTTREFQLISKLVYSRFGINLGENKRTLIIERLQKAVRGGGFTSFKEYYDYVVSDPTGAGLLNLIDKISTNHTYFFREQNHFDFLKSDALPRLIEEKMRQGTRDFRFWSAGCSSGEEAYSLAISLADYFGSDLGKWGIGILATDISVSVLEKAKAGVYSDNQLSAISPAVKRRFFQPAGGGLWSVTPEIRNMVLFRRLNLMNPSYPFKNSFDVIFCRNVMIYFDEPTREGLIERFHRFTAAGGYLFVGHSESLSRQHQFFRYIKPAIYQKIS